MGITYGDGSGSAFNLNAPVAGAIKDSTVRGNELVLRSVLSYAAASRSVGGGAKAFMEGTKFLVGNMMRSIAKRLEIVMLYGQVGIGTAASVSGNVLTVTTGQWAPGIWAGAENMPIEIRDATGATIRGQATITAVDMAARTLTLDAMPVGVVSTDVIWHKGAYGNEMAGVHKILTNTGSLFGIDAAQYNLWKGSQISATTPFKASFALIQKAIAKGVEKGLESDVVVFCNPGHWDDLLTEQAALRMYDSSYSSAQVESGARSIKFHSQNGMVEIVPSIYIKESFMYILSLDEFARIGSSDVTFKRPGEGDQFFRDLENSAGYELRCFSDQALFCFAPGRSVLVDSLVID